MIEYEIAALKPVSPKTMVKLELYPREDGSVALVATRSGATGSVLLRLFADGSIDMPCKVGGELGLVLDGEGHIGTPASE